MSLGKLSLCPTSLREANAYVEQRHRHHGSTRGHLFSLAAVRDGDEEPCGVAIVGRPVSRMLQDGWTCELTRMCSDGSLNVCSFLYGRAWRAAQALGYRRMVTYTLPTESGSSLRGAGWKLIGEAGGGSWDRQTRPRVDTHPTQGKLRWEAGVPG